MTLIKSYQFGHFEDIALLGSNLHLSKKNHKLYSYFLVHLTRYVLLISWGFLVIIKPVESYSEQSLTVTNMSKSKEIFTEM